MIMKRNNHQNQTAASGIDPIVGYIVLGVIVAVVVRFLG
jgi:hypothetical protein